MIVFINKMDVATIALIIGFGSLFVERFFSWVNRIKKSICCLGGEINLAEPLGQDKAKETQK